MPDEVDRELVPTSMNSRAVRPRTDEHVRVEREIVERLVLLVHVAKVSNVCARDCANTVTIALP